jgi:hypothetical protein
MISKALLPFVVISLSNAVRAADSHSVGLNTLFIQEYYWSVKGANCTAYQSAVNAGAGCPSNAAPHMLSQISAIIRNLTVNQHLTTFREIVPFEILSPNGSNDPTGIAEPADTTNYSIMDKVISLFKTYNVHLILAVGNPIPNWAAPWAVPKGNAYGCFVPPASDTTDADTFQNNLSWSVGNYINHLQAPVARGGLGLGTWMSGTQSGGVWVEGFNEWNTNTVYNTPAPSACTDTSGATPQRAALLEKGISRVLSQYYSVTAKLAAPSVVSPINGLSNWYRNYYAVAGAIGAPNVHIYGNGTPNAGSAAAAISYDQAQLNALIASLPSPYNTQIILGETGFGNALHGCVGSASMDPMDWGLYNVLATAMVTGLDPPVTAAVQLMAVWRLDQLSANGSCENTYGVVSSDFSTYQPAGVNMFKYLGGTGVSP